MASLIEDKNNKWRLRYNRDNRAREATFKANKLDAQKMKLIVERRLDQLITGNADPQLTKWLKELDEPLREVLQRCELIEKPPRKVTVAVLAEEFLRPSVRLKPRTMQNRESAMKNLLRFFKPDTPLANITPKNADDFYRWMCQESKTCGQGTALKPGTYLRRIGTIRTAFDLAARYKWIDENPFLHLKGGNATDTSRFHNVTTEDACKIYAACPNAF